MSRARRIKRADRRTALAVLRWFLEDLQARFRRLAPAYFREHPEARRPCATCAFNPSMNRMRGWNSTAMGLMAVCDGTKREFRCHVPDRKLQRGQQYQPAPYECAGMQVLRQDPTLHEALLGACMKEAPR